MNTRNVIVDTTESPHARLRAVPASAVTLSAGFWSGWIERNNSVTIPTQYKRCEETARIDNFRVAAGKKQGEFKGLYFNDSDVHKWLEAACWSLAGRPDADLTTTVDQLLDLIAGAQQPDGYLNTYFMGERAKERWSNLKDKHELYCAGHFIQAAVAHHRAVGGDSALSVAMKLADCICAKFGPAESGKTPGTCGHPEIEMALVELYRETRDRKYLDQARYLIDVRGQKLIGGSSYHQDHKPLRQFDRMDGHAVRMLYLCCGATDLCLERDEPELRATMEKLWTHLTTRQLYITGGVGSRWDGEAFGGDYELPNASAYAETCGAIASIMWSWRMLLLTGDGRYADLIEQTLYNGFLSGLARDGAHYFYQNPLSNDGRHRRVPWFDCACCPPNVARLLASLPGYCLSSDSSGAVWVHQYLPCSASVTTGKGTQVDLDLACNYPWDESITITTKSTGTFELRLRVPGWCHGAKATVNGQAQELSMERGYAIASRKWAPGDKLELHLPMPVRRVEAHPSVSSDTGRTAIMRGPVVYCLEAVDHDGADVRDVSLPDSSEIRSAIVDDPALGTVVALAANAWIDSQPWGAQLYRDVPAASRKPDTVRFVPYYLWSNRAPGAMVVWVRRCD